MRLTGSATHILPNTAGARTADEAVRTARMARAMGLSDWIKVEVIPDPKYLLPDPIGTFEACKTLVDEGFVVLPYINADPALARRLQEIGTHTVMPLASPIGSGQGLKTREQIQIIIEQATVPVVVECGDRRPLGGGSGDGTWRGLLPHQHGHRPCRQSSDHGRGHADGRRGRPEGVPGGPDARPPVCLREQPAGRRRAVSDFRLPCLMLVTEPSPRLPEIVAEAVTGGVDVVQWRENRGKGMGYNRAYGDLNAALKERALLVVNGNWETAVGLGARRIHLPEKSLPIGVVRHRIGAKSLVGKSVHSVSSAEQAEKQGADYLIAGTIFASASHPNLEPSGLEFLREVCAAVSIPVLAIGGVTSENTADCIAAGAAGVAVLSAIMRASDPREAAQTYRAALDAAWEARQ